MVLDFEIIGEIDYIGMMIYFVFDFEIFIEIIVYDYDLFVNCVCELVFLIKGVNIMIEDKCEG